MVKPRLFFFFVKYNISQKYKNTIKKVMFSYLIVEIIYFFLLKHIYQLCFVNKIRTQLYFDGSIFVAQQ